MALLVGLPLTIALGFAAGSIVPGGLGVPELALLATLEAEDGETSSLITHLLAEAIGIGTVVGIVAREHQT